MARLNLNNNLSEWINKDVILIGTRWHYRGILRGKTEQFYFLENGRIIYNTTNGMVSSEQIVGTVACNTDLVCSVSLTCLYLPNEKVLPFEEF